MDAPSCDCDVQNSNGNTALHLAASKGTPWFSKQTTGSFRNEALVLTEAADSELGLILSDTPAASICNRHPTTKVCITSAKLPAKGSIYKTQLVERGY